jgi:hypothetical protein
MPTPPALTDEQRRAAYEKALELRRLRASIKDWVRAPIPNSSADGPALAVDRLQLAFDFPAVQGMKVYDLLTALPNVGPKTARAWLKTAGIPEKNTVRACGPRQVERLFHLLNR